MGEELREDFKRNRYMTKCRAFVFIPFMRMWSSTFAEGNTRIRRALMAFVGLIRLAIFTLRLWLL